MRALLKPPIGKTNIDEIYVRLIGRVSNGRIRTEFNPGTIRAVDRFRLYDASDRRRRLTDQELATLPWQGAGPDPQLDSKAIEPAGGRDSAQPNHGSPHASDLDSIVDGDLI